MTSSSIAGPSSGIGSAGGPTDAADTLVAPGPDMGRLLRAPLGCFATGVTVVTTQGPDGPTGFTANSFTSVSLDPPLVLWCPARSSARHDVYTDTPHFIIHVLGRDQIDLGAQFAGPGGAFGDVVWTPNAEGQPCLPGCLARFECAAYKVHDGGDHSIVVGRVLRAAFRQGDPLVYSRGQFALCAPL